MSKKKKPEKAGTISSRDFAGKARITSDRLGRKGKMTILSKKDKLRSKRNKGENRRKYMSDHDRAGFFIFLPFVILNEMRDLFYPFVDSSLCSRMTKGRKNPLSYLPSGPFALNFTPARPEIALTLANFVCCPPGSKSNVCSLFLSDIRMPS